MTALLIIGAVFLAGAVFVYVLCRAAAVGDAQKYEREEPVLGYEKCRRLPIHEWDVPPSLRRFDE